MGLMEYPSKSLSPLVYIYGLHGKTWDALQDMHTRTHSIFAHVHMRTQIQYLGYMKAGSSAHIQILLHTHIQTYSM